MTRTSDLVSVTISYCTTSPRWLYIILAVAATHIIIIIINEFHHNASLTQNFRAIFLLLPVVKGHRGPYIMLAVGCHTYFYYYQYFYNGISVDEGRF